MGSSLPASSHAKMRGVYQTCSAVPYRGGQLEEELTDSGTPISFYNQIRPAIGLPFLISGVIVGVSVKEKPIQDTDS